MKKFSLENQTLGKLMSMIGLFILFPLITLIWYKDDIIYKNYFLIPGLFSLLMGILFTKLKSTKNIYISRRDSIGYSGLVVLFAWAFGIIMGAMPFFLSGKLNFVQAIFEAVSGFTTTGLSVIDVSKTENIFLFHRSFMQYCGGLGFIMMMILFMSNKNSMSLYSAEGHPDKIKPTIKNTAVSIFFVYILALLFGSIAYKIAGMTWFDSVNHAMCSLSTGGFSTRLNSVGEYNSPSIEFITIILMIIGTTNFASLLILVKGNFKTFFRISEIKFMFTILLIFIPITAFSLSKGLNIGIVEGFRKSSFDVISALSTTGYSTMSYAKRPDLSVAILILMMLIGGGIGSTAGGMKLNRVYLLLKFIKSNLKKKITTNNHIIHDTYVKAQGDVTISSEDYEDNLGFIVTYFLLFILGSLLIVVTADCSIKEAMFDFSSAIGTVGLSMGITNPSTDSLTLIIEIIGMLLGRLEIFIVFVGLSFGFNKIKVNIKRLFEKS
jgi:trk system potassium uptake protein TrkH